MRKSRVERLAVRDGIGCWLCRRPVDLSLPKSDPKHATSDHVTPRSKGGRNSLENLKLAHYVCNHSRGNTLIQEPEPKHHAEPQASGEFPLPFLWPR